MGCLIYILSGIIAGFCMAMYVSLPNANQQGRMIVFAVSYIIASLILKQIFAKKKQSLNEKERLENIKQKILYLQNNPKIKPDSDIEQEYDKIKQKVMSEVRNKLNTQEEVSILNSFRMLSYLQIINMNKSQNSGYFSEIHQKVFTIFFLTVEKYLQDSIEAQIKQAQPSNIEDESKKCPACAEVIKLEAKKCRFCGEIFSDEDMIQAKQTQLAEAEEKRKAGLIQCLTCKRWDVVSGAYIENGSTGEWCPHCKKSLQKMTGKI